MPSDARRPWYSSTSRRCFELLADGAERAERLRRQDADVVFVTGAELSLFHSGFLPGNSLKERTGALLRREPGMRELLAGLPACINDFLAKAVTVVRERFGGKITYAYIPFEGVDWTPFDIVSVDLQRSKEIAHDRALEDSQWPHAGFYACRAWEVSSACTKLNPSRFRAGRSW